MTPPQETSSPPTASPQAKITILRIEDLESALMEIDEETAEGNSEFPPVPEGYPFTPIWLGILGYKKGDKPEHEIAERVLMKLWKQGERGFTGGVFDRGNGKVYLLYPDVLYVEWAEEIIDNGDGNPSNSI